MINTKTIVNEYLGKADWRVKENSNNSYCYPSFRAYLSNHIISDYMLNDVYPSEIAEAHKNGALHIHDLSNGLAVYCLGYDLRALLNEGFGGMPGRVNSKPPASLRTACSQMANFIGVLQSEASGAQAFNSVDTFLAPFVKLLYKKYDNDEIKVKKHTKKCLESLIFNLNVPNRSGEVPFSNFSFDWVIPDDLKNQSPMIGGKIMEFSYADCQKEADLINECFIETMTDGDSTGRIFSFPIPTYSITKDFDWSTRNASLLFALTAKYGTPYFQNFINSDLNPKDVRSMCCRLSLNLKELSRSGGIFNSWSSTGSIGVVTVNLPRLGFLAKTKEQYFSLLEDTLNLATDSLEIKRETISELFEKGLFPYLTRWLPQKFKKHFSTVGIVGMYESLENFGISLQTEEGKQFAEEILEYCLDFLKRTQIKTGNLYNLEETPAESACYRFALKDIELYKTVVYSGSPDQPYYTQGAKLPFNYSTDLFDVLDHQESLSTKYTGGSVNHVFLGEAVEGESAKLLVKKILEIYRVPYITLTPTFSICQSHGYLSGEFYNCPECGEETEVYSRIVGYYSPIKRWNNGKKGEWADRKTFEVDNLPSSKDPLLESVQPVV